MSATQSAAMVVDVASLPIGPRRVATAAVEAGWEVEATQSAGAPGDCWAVHARPPAGVDLPELAGLWSRPDGSASTKVIGFFSTSPAGDVTVVKSNQLEAFFGQLWTGEAP